MQPGNSRFSFCIPPTLPTYDQQPGSVNLINRIKGNFQRLANLNSVGSMNIFLYTSLLHKKEDKSKVCFFFHISILDNGYIRLIHL